MLFFFIHFISFFFWPGGCCTTNFIGFLDALFSYIKSKIHRLPTFKANIFMASYSATKSYVAPKTDQYFFILDCTWNILRVRYRLQFDGFITKFVYASNIVQIQWRWWIVSNIFGHDTKRPVILCWTTGLINFYYLN